MAQPTHDEIQAARDRGYTIEHKVENGHPLVSSFIKDSRHVWSILIDRHELVMGWQTADLINGYYTNHKMFDVLTNELNRHLGE